MNDHLESVRISLRQADGDFFPLFQFGDSEKRSLVLVPAAAAQGRAELQFFQHPEDGSEPRTIGTLSFPDLPAVGGIELRLEAELDPAGTLSVSVSWVAGDRTEAALFRLFDADSETASPSRSLLPRTRGGRLLLGIVFVVLCLGLVLWATIAFANWGTQGPEESPISAVLRSQGVNPV